MGRVIGVGGLVAPATPRLFWRVAPLAAGALFLAEVAIGLITRAMPQVNVMMLTLSAKAAATRSARRRAAAPAARAGRERTTGRPAPCVWRP